MGGGRDSLPEPSPVADPTRHMNPFPRILVLLWAFATTAFAGFTSPTLLLSTATGTVANGGRMVALTGTFDFPDTVQPGYPLNLVVSQGTRFVRYPILGQPVSGTSGTLSDGLLADAELGTLLRD